jgi:hypothetical protein
MGWITPQCHLPYSQLDGRVIEDHYAAKGAVDAVNG